MHWKVNKHMSAPEMGQRQKCTSNRTNRKVHQKDDWHRRSPATGLSQKAHQKQDIYRNAKRGQRSVSEQVSRTDTEVHQKQDRSASGTGQVCVAETGQI